MIIKKTKLEDKILKLNIKSELKNELESESSQLNI